MTLIINLSKSPELSERFKLDERNLAIHLINSYGKDDSVEITIEHACGKVVISSDGVRVGLVRSYEFYMQVKESNLLFDSSPRYDCIKILKFQEVILDEKKIID